MAKIIGVRFRSSGKTYYFDPGSREFHLDDKVIVETQRGLELGSVTITPMEVDDDKIKAPLKEILRPANDFDKRQVEENIEKEKAAYKICRQKIRDHGLDMKLVKAEYTFDRSKLLFYFTADGRVDFRALVKDLASEFRTRIELRQIGVRDETKLLGGLGICGRELCCKTFLTNFAPVSIKMAKEQNLSLNPTKISGMCGRLMCCLQNEEEAYEYLNAQMPKKGDVVETMSGEFGHVKDVNILTGKILVLFEENDTKELREYDSEELKFKPRGRKNGNKGQENKGQDVQAQDNARENKEPENQGQDNARGNNGQGDSQIEKDQENRAQSGPRDESSQDSAVTAGEKDGRDSNDHENNQRNGHGNNRHDKGGKNNRKNFNKSNKNNKKGKKGNKQRNDQNQ